MKSDEMVPCPHCQEDINKNAAACPHCGSDEMTGWSEKNYLDEIDLPDEDDYEEIRQNEFEDEKKKAANRTWIIITGAIVLVVFLLGVLAVLR
jgi:uncharacterized membrane protein YvbJ